MSSNGPDSGKHKVNLAYDLNLPLRAVFVGNTYSGKTQLCVNLLMGAYKHIFRVICAFSPTMEEDDVWDPIDISLFNISKVYTEEKGKRIWDEQAAIAKDKRENILVFIDDNANRLRTGHHEYADMFHYASRHKLISKMSCIQDYVFVNPMMRLQDNEVFVWGNADMRSVDTLRGLMGWAIPKPDFYEIFRYCTKEDYTPIRLSRRPGGSIAVYKGLRELVIPKTSHYQGLPHVVAQEIFSRGIRSPEGVHGDVRGEPGDQPGLARRTGKRGAEGVPDRGAGQAMGGGGEGPEEGDWEGQRSQATSKGRRRLQ